MFISCSSWDKAVEAARYVYLLFFLGAASTALSQEEQEINIP
jgi:hypothetical protein